MADPTKHSSGKNSSEKDKHNQVYVYHPAPIAPGNSINPNSKFAFIRRHILSVLLNIVIAIAFVVAVRYGADYVYSRFRDAGLTPELPYVGEQEGKLKQVDVYLMPFEGFPSVTADQLANILSKELDIKIKTTPAVTVTNAYFQLDPCPV